MATQVYGKRDVWGNEREGYCHSQTVIAYAPAQPTVLPKSWDWLRFEEWLSSLGAAVALGWSVYVLTKNYPRLDVLWETSGPLEFCAITALVWLHAKWRRSVRPR